MVKPVCCITLCLLLAGCPSGDAGDQFDLDLDGYPSPADCDDQDPDVRPGATEIWYDGIDQDCDGASDFDQDGDGYEHSDHGGTDCDDEDREVHPDATETWYDGVDQDCDGASDFDQDGDGYDSDEFGGDDCDDFEADVSPAAEERCNGEDDDCDDLVDDEDDNVVDAGAWYADGDGDGAGSGGAVMACKQPAGHAAASGDCDDEDPARYPGVVEEELGISMTCVGPGSFVMGSPETEVGRGDDEDQREVAVEHAMRIALFEVTAQQFHDRLGFLPYGITCMSCAVDFVTWAEAAAFANALSDEAGLERCYDCRDYGGHRIGCTLGDDPEAVLDCEGYRLPSRAEWERATRGGTTTAFSNGGELIAGHEESCDASVALDIGQLLNDIGVFCGSGVHAAAEVGTREPNPWGLHDVHGNVWEWTNDWSTGHDTYPEAWLLGGGWIGYPRDLRSAAGFRMDMYDRFDWAGFRIARTD